jgi:hypothetical protein
LSPNRLGIRSVSTTLPYRISKPVTFLQLTAPLHPRPPDSSSGGVSPELNRSIYL